jgi:hypothetical protein
LPPFEFAETTINMAAATKQQPAMAYRAFMTTLLPGQANDQTKRRWDRLAASAYSGAFLILLAIHFRPGPISLISNRIKAPMVASMIAEIVPEPR